MMGGMDERGMLMAYLDAQRRHVRATLDGLNDEAAHRAPLPSGWSLLGAVQHLALDVERFWFRWVMAGEKVTLSDDAWAVPTDEGVARILDLYERECRAADAVIVRMPLDARPVQWPDDWGPCHMENLRDVILHVIAETATHAGQLDAARELIDGRRHLVMT